MAVSLILFFGFFAEFIFKRFNIPDVLFLIILGGISSAFVIPILKQLNVKGEVYSILTLESALTDVLCIVFALATMQIIKLNKNFFIKKKANSGSKNLNINPPSQVSQQDF